MIVSSPSLSSRASKSKHGHPLVKNVDTRTRVSCSKHPRGGPTKNRKSDSANSECSQCADSASHTPTSVSSKSLSHVPCKFFKQGACQAGDKCPFSHAVEGSQAADKTPCKFFQKGNCKFGQKCALAHILPNGQRVNPRRSLSSSSSKAEHPKADRRSLSFMAADEAESRPRHNRSQHSQPNLLRRLSEPLSPIGLADSYRRLRLSVDSHLGMPDLSRTHIWCASSDTDLGQLYGGSSDPGLAIGPATLSDLGEGHAYSPCSSLKELFSYAWQLLAPLLTLPLAVPVSQMQEYIPQCTSSYYNNVFGQATSPPARRDSQAYSFLVPSGPHEMPGSAHNVDSGLVEDICYDDVLDDVFLEDYIPESLSGILLTPQELVCRQSRSQLGTLSSRPTITRSRRASVQDIAGHFLAATSGHSYINHILLQNMDYAISSSRNHENVFVMD